MREMEEGFGRGVGCGGDGGSSLNPEAEAEKQFGLVKLSCGLPGKVLR